MLDTSFSLTPSRQNHAMEQHVVAIARPVTNRIIIDAELEEVRDLRDNARGVTLALHCREIVHARGWG